jgi:hypothetical protein
VGVKVIEPGRQQNGWSTECVCTGSGNGGGGCGAKLLVESHDLYKTTIPSLDEVETCVTFQCVSCGVQTDLKGDVLRSLMRSPVYDRLRIDNHRGRR